MKKVLEYLKPQKGFIIFILFVKFAGTFMDLLIPWTLGKIIDDVVPSCTADNMMPIFKWGALMLLFSAVAYLGSAGANRGSARIARNVIGNYRKDLFEKILSLSPAQIDKFTVPSLVSRMSSDTYFVQTMLVDIMRGGIRAPILLIGGIVITLLIEPVLALTFIVLLPILGVIAFYISRKGFLRFREKQSSSDNLVTVIRDDFAGIRVIKALSKTDFEKEHFNKVNLELSKKEQVAGATVAATKPILTMFLHFAMAAVIAIGAYRVSIGKTMPGQIISFISYINIILTAIITISRIFTVISSGAASADRIESVFKTEPELKVIEKKREDGCDFIEFRNVTFKYASKKIPSLKNVSFNVKKGETLGIIGGTGSGKSTIISLLLRFYDPDEGEILIDGRDIRSIPFSELYSMFGITFQNDFIFADTVSENIRFSRNVNMNEIKKSAEIAQASGFIELLEDKYNYNLYTRGTNVSGGQKQRILISRALAGNSSILILDDASSALDYKTDSKLREDIRQNIKDKTCVLVAQRVSSVRMSDNIIVLEQGKIIGQGKDDDLMQTCPVYREIAYSQMGEFGA